MENRTRPARSMAAANWLDALAVPLARFDAAGQLVQCNAAWTALCTALPKGDATLSSFVRHFTDGQAEPSHGALLQPAALPDRVFRLDLQAIDGDCIAMLVDVTREAGTIDHLKFKNHVRNQLLADAQVGTWSFEPDVELYSISDELTGDDERAQGRVPLAELRAMQHPDDVSREDEIRHRLTREPGAAASEMRYRMQNGSLLHLLVHYRTGRRTPGGRYEMYGLSQNVTAVAQARDDARAATTRLRLALDAARAGVYEYDYASGSNWISPELAAMLSPEALEEAQAQPTAMFAPQDTERLQSALDVQNGAEIAPLEVRLRHADGDRWINLYYEIERDADGRPRRGVGLVLDIEERKQQALALEEAHRVAEAATQAKSQFLATVSHEIRTPMNGVVGVLNLLQLEQLSEQGQRLAREAVACGDMLSRLLNDILDFSKIEAGKLELSPAPTDAGDAIRGVIDLLRPTAIEKGLYLRTELPEQPGAVMVDPLRLRQCLFNLVGNALKFTEMGGVVVRLRSAGEP
ncbi:MAG: histidine kinase dimerization/phospho-acceptor domain-containing protein, partial [Caulobacteraceae bacterium]